MGEGGKRLWKEERGKEVGQWSISRTYNSYFMVIHAYFSHYKQTFAQIYHIIEVINIFFVYKNNLVCPTPIVPRGL